MSIAAVTCAPAPAGGTRGNLSAAAAAAPGGAAVAFGSPDASGAATGGAAGAHDVAPANAEEAAVAMRCADCARPHKRLRAAACAGTMPPLLEPLHGPSRLALLSAPEKSSGAEGLVQRPPPPPAAGTSPGGVAAAAGGGGVHQTRRVLLHLTRGAVQCGDARSTFFEKGF